MGDFVYTCDQCPRTFKLEEFYEKHKKVHQLKKQHRCQVCGFVYGAAKGLEGHMKTHTEAEQIVAAAAVAKVTQPQPPQASGPPISPDFRFLNPRGVLAAQPVVAPPLPLAPAPQQVVTNPLAAMAAAAAAAAAAESRKPDISDAKPMVGGTGNYRVYGKKML